MATSQNPQTPPLVDTPASHLRNALQILQLLSHQITECKDEGADEPADGLIVRSIGDANARISFALELLERKPDPSAIEAYREMQRTNAELSARGDQLAVEEELAR